MHGIQAGARLGGERQVARLRARRFGRGRFRGLEIDMRQQRGRDDLGSQDLHQFDRVHDGAVLAAMTNYRTSSGLDEPLEVPATPPDWPG